MDSSPADDSAFVRVTDLCRPLDWRAIFGRDAPVHIDLGAGDGGFAAAFAALHPGVNLLAVERLLGRARKIDRKARRLALANLRVLRLESAYTVEFLVPPGSLAVIHLMHPDPWPKKRHHKNRLVHPAFALACARALAPGGELRVTLDHPGYFRWIYDVLEACPRFRGEPWRPGPDYPRSDFEADFTGRGKVVFRHRWIVREGTPGDS